MPTFQARVLFRRHVMWYGLAWLVACGAIAALLVGIGAATAAPWAGGAGGVGYLVFTFAAMIPRDVTFSVDAGVLAPSWRRSLRLEDRTTRLGTWVLAGLDTSIGSVLYAGNARDTLRIGGEGHDASAYDVTGSPSRTVDCVVPAARFEELLAVFGIRRGVTGDLVVPLVRSSQTVGGLVRMMAPWLLTIGACAALGLGVGATAAGERFYRTPFGMFAITGLTVAIVIAGIVTMVVRSRRIRAPELELRVEPTGLAIARTGGDDVARAMWSAVTAEARRYTMHGRGGPYPMPVLVLTVGDHEPLSVGVWDHRLDWPGQVARSRRSARWLMGTAQWQRLVETLRAQSRLR